MLFAYFPSPFLFVTIQFVFTPICNLIISHDMLVNHCPSSKIVISKCCAKYNNLHVRTVTQEQNCALLCYYASSSGNFLQTFRDNLLVPLLGFKWKFLADVSGQPMGPVLGVQVVIS